MADLSKTVGTMEYDGLITDLTPAVQIGGGVIRKLSVAATLKRGTVLAMSSGTSGDNKLVILGTEASGSEVLTANFILCDDTEVGTDADVTAAVYTAGCFNASKITATAEYTLSEADKDNLRMRGIVLKAAAPAN